MYTREVSDLPDMNAFNDSLVQILHKDVCPICHYSYWNETTVHRLSGKRRLRALEASRWLQI